MTQKKETVKTNYNVTIVSTSKELTARERIMMKDTSNAVKLDEAVQIDTPLVVQPVGYAELTIHNEKSDNKDYQNYIIIDKEGHKFVTGSASFWESFMEIWEEMDGEEEEFQIEIYKKESKNYKGKHFLSCSII